MIIKGYAVGPLLHATRKEILEDGIPGLAAQTAYYFFFSLFPLFLFLAPTLAFIGDKEKTFGWLIAQLGSVLPGEGMALIRDVVKDVVYSENAPGIMSIGAVLAIWSGSNVFTAIMGALNTAYDVTETRKWWKRRLIAVAAVIGAGIVLLLTTAIMLGGTRMASWLGKQVGLSDGAVTVWSYIQFPLAFAMLVGMAWLIFYFLPNVSQHPWRALAGALAAAVLWILVTLLFRAYVANFGAYNKTYGTIGGVIVLMTWMYLCMLVLLSAGELNAELEHGTGATVPPSGAVYLGRITTGDGPGLTSTDRVIKAGPGKNRS
jgi:membrane protein